MYLWWRIARAAKAYPSQPVQDGELPRIAVFLAARNEEANLPGCLEALGELYYPADKITFYVGDDASSDGSRVLLERWGSRWENRQIRFFDHNLEPGQNGKATVLAAMIEEAEADLYLFTDADCRVPPTWAQELVGAFRAEFGLMTGMTQVVASGWFGRMQAIEWWLSLGMVKVVADLGFCLTAMGNNMLISAEGYRQVGGFEAVFGSVTEDLAISSLMFKAGYRPVHLVNGRCLVQTNAIGNFSELMDQRKRWARGALSLSLFWVVLLAVQVAFFPMVLAGIWSVPGLFLAGWVLKVGVQSVFIATFAGKTETKIPILDLMLFESYFFVSSMATLFYYIWPSPIRWKSRSYR
ncbi:polysaccharide-forming b-glycosyltransferase-related protein, glycosyltransferase family 2 protein [Lunatimonas lonarensis]|uniref:Polysaccharide-forming b-glycosyltransferase-related protein, glycosyltransferase family 2 protein n=2 Tax=Lunatimonas lonarensis TaxID=1232681 RepID=R7ZZD9_9BACT|nr:polysaccharide-forming b-glycosyltransferase-related protein, glycosyltransferase family 2 protein [Lunatimonas lonarensis]